MMNNKYIVKSLSKLKKKGMYKIIINDTPYEVSEDFIVNNTLVKNKELTQEEFDRLLLGINNEKYFYKVYNYISYQMRSEKEIEQYLLDLGCTKEISNSIITRLKNLMLIDDKSLSKAILNSCINNHKGPNYYLKKLKDRKIGIIHEYNKDDEVETLIEAIEKNKLKKTKYPVQKQKQLLIQKMLRDGFSDNLVYKHIHEIEFEDESKETLLKEIDKLFYKYTKNISLEDKKSKYEIKQKIINNLMNKGYSYKDIITCINNSEDI